MCAGCERFNTVISESLEGKLPNLYAFMQDSFDDFSRLWKRNASAVFFRRTSAADVSAKLPVVYFRGD